MIETRCVLKDYSTVGEPVAITMDSYDGSYVLLQVGEEYVTLSVPELMIAIENCAGIRLNPSARWEKEVDT